jgi:predicted patatin/cPLA2 family phospholipase
MNREKKDAGGAVREYGSCGDMPGGKKAIVVEGGGMRGIFAAGVLDVFLQSRFNPFDILIGVSSGSVILASYLSGQYRRYYRILTGPMSGSDFLSFRRFFKGGHLMDLDWLWAYAAEHDPLDIAAATAHPGKEYLVTATDVDTAQSVFLQPDGNTFSDFLKASCALPVMYRDFVKVDGRRVADGGVADPIPVREAYRRGARQITVIRTRQRTSPKGFFLDNLMAALFLRGYPGIRSRIRDLHLRYEDTVRFIHNPPADACMVEIAPPVKLKGARLSTNLDFIRLDYETGRKAGEEYLSRHA